MNDKSKVSEEGPRSFALVLQQVADGQCHIDASEELHALLAECARVANATRGEAKGELLLKLSFSVEAEPSSLVSVKYSIKTKAPEKKRPAGLFWLTKGKNLSQQNPRQQQLPLREVNKDMPPPVEVAATGADAREVIL